MPRRKTQLSWDDLRFFLATYRTGTLSKVAQTIGVDHTTVARRVERLEKALKTKLFERRNTGYVPTAAAERLLLTAEAVESTIASGEADLADRDLSLAGTVRVGAPDGFGTFFLAAPLARFCALHPDVDIQLLATSRLFSLSKREADIAIALAVPEQQRVVAKKLTDYRLGLYCSREYQDKHGALRSASELKDRLFISYIDEALYTPVLDYVGQISRHIVPRFRSVNLIAQFNAVKAGHGIGVLPAFMADPDPDLVPQLRKEVRLDRTFYLLLHEDNRNLARVTAVADFITDEVRRHRALFKPAD